LDPGYFCHFEVLSQREINDQRLFTRKTKVNDHHIRHASTNKSAEGQPDTCHTVTAFNCPSPAQNIPGNVTQMLCGQEEAIYSSA